MQKLKTVAIYNTKGGVGKTSLSYNISKDLEFRYITNDMSVSLMKMPKAKLLRKNIPLQENTLYDFGGFEDSEALNIVNQTDLVIIPTICDMNSIARTLALLKKIKHNRILVVGTMIEKEKDFSDIKQVINHHYPQVEIAQFRRTKLLKNAMENGIGAVKLYNSKKLYRKAFIEYNHILKKCIQE